MIKCHRCKQSIAKADMIGCNIFDASTGMHITTRWYCSFCIKTIGLLSEVKIQ